MAEFTFTSPNFSIFLASKISNSTEESVRLEALTDMHIRVWVKWERREGMCQSNQWLFKRLSFSILINIGKGPESMPPPPQPPALRTGNTFQNVCQDHNYAGTWWLVMQAPPLPSLPLSLSSGPVAAAAYD